MVPDEGRRLRCGSAALRGVTNVAKQCHILLPFLLTLTRLDVSLSLNPTVTKETS